MRNQPRTTVCLSADPVTAYSDVMEWQKGAVSRSRVRPIVRTLACPSAVPPIQRPGGVAVTEEVWFLDLSFPHRRSAHETPFQGTGGVRTVLIWD